VPGIARLHPTLAFSVPDWPEVLLVSALTCKLIDVIRIQSGTLTQAPIEAKRST
jgi:hypothetical protein